MLALLNAIYAQFTSDSALTAAFPGGLHRDRAPEGTAMPYVVSHVAASHVENAYGSNSRNTTQVKFSAFGVGHDAAGSLAATLVAHFDNVLLSLSAGTHDSIVRLGEPVPALLRHDAMGNDVWEWSVVYEYGVSG
ncbi:MAG: hypothetical protein JWN24_50 [Phycisphaerales bacterium]|nr:hypothetical protein [Phycisphaerales bacterium]